MNASYCWLREYVFFSQKSRNSTHLIGLPQLPMRGHLMLTDRAVLPFQHPVTYQIIIATSPSWRKTGAAIGWCCWQRSFVTDASERFVVFCSLLSVVYVIHHVCVRSMLVSGLGVAIRSSCGEWVSSVCWCSSYLNCVRPAVHVSLCDICGSWHPSLRYFEDGDSLRRGLNDLTNRA